MIDRREIFDLAAQTSLTPHVVEKDYVLGWMLAGIYAHEELAESWLFKGETCLKKCFFETYRFSEDLDSTLRDEAQIEEGFLKRVFGEIAAWIRARVNDGAAVTAVWTRTPVPNRSKRVPNELAVIRCPSPCALDAGGQ